MMLSVTEGVHCDQVWREVIGIRKSGPGARFHGFLVVGDQLPERTQDTRHRAVAKEAAKVTEEK